MEISIETSVHAPMDVVWKCWTTPEDIQMWNFASDEWCCPKAEISLVEGGRFSYRMEAKDGSAGFDFEGEFTGIQVHKRIKYSLADGRRVRIEFIKTANDVKLVETFESDDEYSAEQQRQGWLSILANFKKHVESKSN